jgi:hypothetical protein
MVCNCIDGANGGRYYMSRLSTLKFVLFDGRVSQYRNLLMANKRITPPWTFNVAGPSIGSGKIWRRSGFYR